MIADSVTRALRDIDAAILRPGGWDAAPSLYLLHADRGPLDLDVFPLDSFQKALSLAPDSATPRQILGGYARAVALTHASWPHRVEAAVFSSEAWSVQGNALNIAEKDQVEAAASRREIHKHPARVEIRMLTSVDRHGAVRSLMYSRGSETDVVEMSDADGTGPDQLRMEGTVVDGLLELVRAFVPKSS